MQPRRQSLAATEEKPEHLGKAYLPYITNRIGNVLSKQNVFTVYQPTGKLQSIFTSSKDKRRPLALEGVYGAIADQYTLGPRKGVVTPEYRSRKGISVLDNRKALQSLNTLFNNNVSDLKRNKCSKRHPSTNVFI